MPFQGNNKDSILFKQAHFHTPTLLGLYAFLPRQSPFSHHLSVLLHT